ncbi:MAG: FRG domain protein [Elusimicrobia bacterium ADurb.Bin231]|nr:MAG: FRG domain protein [Elusimicrobia bacterium ADurb.Bin231]
MKKYPYAIIKIPFLEFWIYTRHHGFPSPLLDWSASPYIAAFFAFEDQLTKAGNIAIYAYFEPIETSSDSDNPSRIRIIGEPGLRTHERHYLQQSWYTLAYLTDEPNNKHVISDYNNLFLKEEYVFVKIIIPKSQGIQALTYLHEHNINNFSLMHSEESLLKTMAFKLLTI